MSEDRLMHDLLYYQWGLVPDVIQGSDGEAHIFELGEDMAALSVTPREWVVLRARVDRVIERIREEELQGVTREERDAAQHLITPQVAELPSASRTEPFGYAPSPHEHAPDPHAQRDRLIGVGLCILSALLVASIFVIATWAVSLWAGK